MNFILFLIEKFLTKNKMKKCDSEKPNDYVINKNFNDDIRLFFERKVSTIDKLKIETL